MTFTGSQGATLRATAVTGAGTFIGSHKFFVSAPSTAQNEELLGLVGHSGISHCAYGTRHNSKAIRHKEVGN